MASNNPVVRAAYDAGTYTDADGKVWTRGMDGWFLQHPGEDIYLIRHDDMVKIIEQENS